MLIVPDASACSIFPSFRALAAKDPALPQFLKRDKCMALLKKCQDNTDKPANFPNGVVSSVCNLSTLLTTSPFSATGHLTKRFTL